MLTTLRRYINTWPVRVLFILLVGSFALWGIADVVRNIGGGSSTAVATVGGQSIEPDAVEQAFQRQLAQVSRMFGGKFSPTPEIRRSIASQALERLITQAVVEQQARRMGLTVTDDALRAATYAIPAFRGKNGQFDRTTFQTVLQNNGLDEAHFLGLIRSDLQQQQLIGAVRAGATAPDLLVENLFAYQQEKRVADAVFVPFAAVAPPADPSEAQLERWWSNNPDLYSKPEYRRIKAVILSAQTIARDIDISDEALHAAYDQRLSLYDKPEKRSVEILLTADEAKAQALAAQWSSGADWTQMQKAAADAGATALDLPGANRGEFPDPALAEAVFAAAPDVVPAPIHDTLGWHVIKVTEIVPAAHRSFEEVKEELRRQLAEQQASEQIFDRANKVEDALAGGGGLDELPQGLGLAAVTGTLDAKGDTPDGEPAPIPAAPAVKSALIAAAFAGKPGDPPRLTEVPPETVEGQPPGPSAYYAVTVESITPPARQPFDQVKDRVREDWTADAMRHEADTMAAGILSAIKSGQSLTEAVQAAKLSVRRLPPTGRQTPPQGVPPQLLQPLFGMKLGEPTMVETADGFVVAVLAEINTPDAKTDPIGFGQVRQSVERAIADDIETVYVNALRLRAKPQVNMQALNAIVQP